MRNVEMQADFAVVGGGMAGVVAAIAAARLGHSVILVQDRPVLGGNASSEIRVWVGGAQGHVRNRFAREGGILNEMLMEQLYRNPHSAPPVWNAILLDFVLAEPNITLLLDTAVDGLTMGGDGHTVDSVSAYCSISQTRYTISARHFADCSGDSIVGVNAGAEFRIGKEGRAEFDEQYAPDEPDPRLLGASLYWYSRDCGHPVRYVRPEFAIDISDSPRIRNIKFPGTIRGCELWWLEYGGLRDTVHEAGDIKRYLTSVVYGLWDYIKNSGKFPDAENLDLEWVGPMPGKRESYRLMGPHLLTEHDLFKQPHFDDACATGGWTIDHHPSGGIHSKEAPSRHIGLPGPYNIPLRTLFSRNISNLWMSGRNMSASNVAFGSIRLMGTGAVCGQAVGTAVHYCLENNLSANQLVADKALLEKFSQQLLKDDQHIIHLPNRDPADMARNAAISDSGSMVLHGTEANLAATPTACNQHDHWLMLPIASPQLEWIELLADVDADTTLEMELRRNDAGHHYFPTDLLDTCRLELKAGRQQWLRVPVELALAEPANIWFTVKANPHLSLYPAKDRFTGCLASRGNELPWPNPRTELFAFRLSHGQDVYRPENITNGYARPYVMPNVWMSEAPVSANAGESPWVELSWPQEQRISEIRLYLSHDVDMQIPTMLMDFPFSALPTVLKEATLLAEVDGEMKMVAEIRDNHRRMLVLKLSEPVLSRRLRLAAEATWGAARAEIFEIRVYD